MPPPLSSRMTFRPRDFLAAGRAAARAADGKKARDVRLFDVRRVSGLADYYLLATADSAPHLQALLDAVEERVAADAGLAARRRDGAGSARWSVIDFGGLVVHLLRADAREFYSLERLWEGARPVDWRAGSPAAREASPRSPALTGRRRPQKPVAPAGRAR